MPCRFSKKESQIPYDSQLYNFLGIIIVSLFANPVEDGQDFMRIHPLFRVFFLWTIHYGER